MAAVFTAEDIKLLKQAANAGLLGTHLRWRCVAITGRLSMKREDLIMLINAVGGTYVPRVSAGADMLVVGDTGRHGITRKIMDAQRRRVEVIDEDEFVRRLQSWS